MPRTQSPSYSYSITSTVPIITSLPVQVTPSSTTEMRTKLFPDEAAEALDELEYHPHHVHGPGTRAPGGGVGATTVGAGHPATTSTLASSPEPAIETGGTSSASFDETGSGRLGKGGAAGNRSSLAGGTVEGGNERKVGAEGGAEGTLMQRMNKTFRPDPLGAYTGDRSTLKFKPRRQEGLIKLRPRQLRTVFDASQISPMLQVRGGEDVRVIC